MPACKIFISYSHADEWLKDELVSHFAALKRNGLVDVWHDRKIPPGGILDDQIDIRMQSSDLILLLISTDFINSDYCFHKEYEQAVKLRERGLVEIVPIVIRECDWDVGELKHFNALPPDAIPVTRNAVSREDKQQRDPAWVKVIEGIKTVIQEITQRSQPPKPLKDFHDQLFTVDFIRHPSLARFDERLILIDPDIYCETEKEQVSTFSRLFEMCSAEKASIITGSDRCGKSVVAKTLHNLFSKTDHPAIIINGRQIKNKDIQKLISTARNEQFEPSSFPIGNFRIIIDDFDECILPDRIKELIVEAICETFFSCILFSFTNAPSVLFTSEKMPAPAIFLINPVTDAKLFTLVEKWLSIGIPPDEVITDDRVLPVFERIQLVFDQTGLDKAPHTAATFLQFIDTLTGSDISFSSYAACYDMLIAARLSNAKVSIQSFDEARNFLSLVAYRAYTESGSPSISLATFEDCLSIFETQYLSSTTSLRQIAIGLFLEKDNGEYRFLEEYLWFFLCARYVVKFLQANDHVKYTEFVKNCTANIFQRKFANIVIYIAYFSNDKLVLESLLQTLDSLFSKAGDWIVSDDDRELIVGLATKDSLAIESASDVSENRMSLLQEKIADIIEDAERVVARYTLPFLSPKIGDSGSVENIEVTVDHDSYMRTVNALLRTHSVIGQILSARSGTFSADLVLDCITRMVKASGRYVALNHAIAAVLIYDRDNSIQVIERTIRGDHLSAEEKYEKVTRIFAFWSVYISHAGLARYLTQEHSIRALDILSKTEEGEDKKTPGGNVPFNFTLVKTVAQLYNSGRIDRRVIDDILQRYGENSALVGLLRAVVHMYAYYMPLAIEDKQWVSNKLRMPLRKIEVQRLKAITAAKRSHSKAHKE
jgi:hypothetical protein